MAATIASLQTTSIIASPQTTSIDPSSQLINTFVEHAIIKKNCTLINCQIRGLPDQPILIEDNCELLNCTIIATGKSKSFRFGQWHLQSPTTTTIQKGCSLTQTFVENSSIGEHTEAIQSSIRHSFIATHNILRPHSSFILTRTAPHAHLGSELSKTILEGQGFVSEHTASYLSLIAPAHYPILDENNEETLLHDLPNLTNIGAGTVFANYGGQPKPAPSLDQSSGSQKGTAIAYGTFTAVNSIILNRYGQPSNDLSPFDLLRHNDLTILGFASLVERKVTGRIPAFSRASQTSASQIQIGWVLDKKPGIILNLIKKMKKQLKEQTYRLQHLIEGTLRLEIQLLTEQLEQHSPLWNKKQLETGIKLLSQHLDGRWKLDEQGDFIHPWFFDHSLGNWRSSTS